MVSCTQCLIPSPAPGPGSLSGGCCDSELAGSMVCAAPAPAHGSDSISTAPCLLGRALNASPCSIPPGDAVLEQMGPSLILQTFPHPFSPSACLCVALVVPQGGQEAVLLLDWLLHGAGFVSLCVRGMLGSSRAVLVGTGGMQRENKPRGKPNLFLLVLLSPPLLMALGLLLT